MLPTNITTDHASRMASHASGFDTGQASLGLASPLMMLGYIEVFFTGNEQSEERARQYDTFAQAASDAIHLACLSRNSLNIPEILLVNFSEYTATFTCPGENHHASSNVIIEVMKNGKKVVSEVDHDRFCTISTALLLRQRGGLPTTSILLTGQGDMDLRGANLLEHDLSHVDLKNADLSGANLCGAKLNGANLSKAKLIQTNLHGANLNEANLSEAKLIQTNLLGANLSKVNLSRATLRGVNLSNTVLGEANLRGAELGRVNLSKADLHQADLRGVRLSWGTNLVEADLQGANLRGTNLNSANLAGATLYEADLSEARLIGVHLSKVNLQGADLTGANLCRANLHEANLTGASLSRASLCGANLRRADLSGANLHRTDLSGANLHETNLSHLSPEGALLYLPDEWTPGNSDIYLNHINNRESGSLLTMIDSIDTQYTDIKLRLARELMASLQGVSAEISGSVALPLLDVLSKKPYIGHADIAAWLDTVSTTYLSQYHAQLLPPLDLAIFNHFANLFTHQPSLMFSLNGAFIQLLHQAMSQHAAADRARAAGLYERYLSDDKAQRYTHLDDFGAYGTHRVDWQDEHAANYLLFSSHDDHPVMLCSQNTLHGLLQSDSSHPVWHRFYLYDNQAVALHPTAIPLETLFKIHFPLFLEPYQYEKHKACFGLLLDALDLGDMHTLFVSATGAITSATKLVDPEHQLKLAEIFGPKLQYCSGSTANKFILEPAHYHKIIEIYRLTASTDSTKAQTLLSLAAVFTRYSSSAIFGQENESPEMLRHYAYALMEKAHTLEANVFNNVESKDVFPEWSNKLLGIDNAFSCTAVLSSSMVSHIKATFPDILATIMPPAWN